MRLLSVFIVVIASFMAAPTLANPHVQLSEHHINVIRKLQSVTDFDASQAANAMIKLFDYQKSVDSVLKADGLNTAQRRVRIKAARKDLETELRETMSRNQIRKWLDYSLPQVHMHPVAYVDDGNHAVINADWLDGQWQNRGGLP